MIRNLDDGLAFSRDLLKQMYDSFPDSIHPKAAIFIYKSSLLSLSKYDRQGQDQINTNNKLVL